MKWEILAIPILAAGAWVPIVVAVYFLIGGPIMDQAKIERHVNEQSQLRLDQERAGRRAAFTARLGFDPENGGRRFGELIVQELQETPQSVMLYIPGSLVSIEQVRRIRSILLEKQTNPLCPECGGLGVFIDHDEFVRTGEERCTHCTGTGRING